MFLYLQSLSMPLGMFVFFGISGILFWAATIVWASHKALDMAYDVYYARYIAPKLLELED